MTDTVREPNTIHWPFGDPREADDARGDNSGVARDQIRAFVERVERLNEELKAINDDKKEIFAEAKSLGYDTKALKRVIQLRGQDQSERQEFEAIVDLYLHALGMAQ